VSAHFDHAQIADAFLPPARRLRLAGIGWAALAPYLFAMNRRPSPFDEGVLAAETGMSRDDNPYKRGTAAHSDWSAGFDSGKDADEATKLDHDWRGEPS
jgi:hypothetical protein